MTMDPLGEPADRASRRWGRAQVDTVHVDNVHVDFTTGWRVVGWPWGSGRAAGATWLVEVRQRGSYGPYRLDKSCGHPPNLGNRV